MRHDQRLKQVNERNSFLLVRHPPVLARLREEINVIVKENSSLTRAHIRKLHYLKCVLSESVQIPRTKS